MEIAHDRLAASLEAFVRTRFDVRADDTSFTRWVHLFEEGYVDSTGLVELVAFIESEFQVAVPEDAFFDPSFNSIDGIASAVVEIAAEGGYMRASYIPG